MAPFIGCAEVKMAWLLMILVGGLYLRTLPPTVTYGGDCGELIAASYTLGLPHPTGYPFYLLLGRLFASLMPIGTVAFRYNLLSAFCGVLAVGLVYKVVYLLTADVLASFVAGVALAGSYVFWAQSLIAEVYALHALAVALAVFSFLRWRATGDRRWLYSLALTFGLGLGNHSSLFLLLPAVLIGVVLRRREAPVRGRNWAVGGALLLAGLLLYLYLPVRSAQHPLLNWGQPDTWERFWAHVTGRQYADRMFAFSLPEVIARLRPFGKVFWGQFPWLFPLGFWGAWELGRKYRDVAALTGTAIVLYSLVFLNYDVGDVWNYFLPAYLLWAIWMGIGLAAAYRALVNKPKWTAISGFWGLTFAVTVALARQYWYVLPYTDYSSNRRAEETARAMLNAVEPNAVLLAVDDEFTFSLWYLQYVEGIRPEVQVVMLDYREPPRQVAWAQQFLAETVPQRPVYLTYWSPTLAAGWFLEGRGMLVRLRAKPRPPACYPPSTYQFWVTVGGRLEVAHFQVKPVTVKRGGLATVTLHWRFVPYPFPARGAPPSLPPARGGKGGGGGVFFPVRLWVVNVAQGPPIGFVGAGFKPAGEVRVPIHMRPQTVYWSQTETLHSPPDSGRDWIEGTLFLGVPRNALAGNYRVYFQAADVPSLVPVGWLQVVHR